MSAAKHTPAWPTHPDGRPMRFGEMTPEQRREQAKAAAQRVAAEMTANAPAIAKVLADFDAEQAAIAKATGSAA